MAEMKIKLMLIACIMVLVSAPLYAGSKTVTLMTTEWEPYVGTKIASNGFTYSIVKEAFQRAGYKVEVKFDNWSKGMEITEQGRADGIFPAYYDEEREARFVFSMPFGEGPVGLYKRTSLPSPTPVQSYERAKNNITYSVDPRLNQKEALMGLKNFTFGVVKGYVTTPEFDKATFLKKIEANDDLENLRNLFKRKVDLIVIDKYTARQLIATKFPWYTGELEFMEPPLDVKTLHVAFSKQVDDHEQKLRDFNAALKLMKEDGRLEQIMVRHGF